MLRRLRNDQKGFTLMEIVIVIVILGILALLAVPRLIGFTDQARVANDKEYAALVAKSAELYWASHDKTFTDITGMGATSVLKDFVDAPADVLQYNDGTASVNVEVVTAAEATAGKTVTDSMDLKGDGDTTTTLAVDEGVAIVTINYTVGTATETIEYTSQYGYNKLP